MILIALGANLPSHQGAPTQTLHAALRRLDENGASIVAVSRFFGTPAWPDPSDPPFVNAAAMVETWLSPDALMSLLAETEAAFGRSRGVRNAPRTLDLDLIDHDGLVCDGELVLPHPRAAERAFVLIPIADIAPTWTHPVTGLNVQDLIDVLPAEARTQIVPLALG